MSNIIVTIHDSLSPIRGGGGLRTLKTALEFKKRGHNVRIFAPSNTTIIEGIPVECLNAPIKEKMFSTTLKFNLYLLLKLIKNRNKIDIIFCHNAIAGILCTFFSKVFGKKIILDVTDIHTEYLLSAKKNVLKRLPLMFFRKLEYWSFKKADTLIVVSKAMRDLIVKNGVKRDHIYVVYDGVDVSDFDTKKERKNHISIIHHGGIDAQDGVHYIPMAAKKILKKHPKTKFLIVGGGSRLEQVKAVAKKERVLDSFIFYGWRPYSEMRKFLKKADIGLITRPNTLPNNTILTLKLLEYWASATASVVPKLNAIMEVSSDKEDALFYEPNNYEDLADKVCYLIDHKNLLRDIQMNGMKKARAMFQWGILIKKIVDTSLIK